MHISFQSLLAIAAALPTLTSAIPYSEYIIAPNSRIIHPASVYKVNGTVTDAESLASNITGNATFKDVSAVTYDYGKNIAGRVSLTIGSVSDVDQYIGVTFTESSKWISGESCDATADAGDDSAIWFHVTGPGVYTPPKDKLRGGFRYLSLVHNSTGTVYVTGVSTNFTAMPHVTEEGLRNYTGYFHCDDEKLNKVWYAGAYTNQMCTIDPTTGNALVHPDITLTDNISYPLTWYYNYTISNGSSVITDGAKRDRLIWPGDMSIAVPSIFVSTHDLVSVRNGLDALLILQNETGLFPYASEPFNTEHHGQSYTYHLHTMIGMYFYYMYTGNLSWLSENWSHFTRAMAYALESVDDTGLANLTLTADWLRFGMGGHNIEANAILYYVLDFAPTLASAVNDTDTTTISNWTTTAASIKSAANSLLYSETLGLYTDNETTTLCPQDGNSWAVLANLTLSDAQASNISTALAARWGQYGAPAPEADETVSPFISGFELKAHIFASAAQNAIDLIRFMWYDFMMDSEEMTNSTFIEGYSTDGSMHYAPYNNDPRVSHAHGWSTGPTSVLTNYIAGIELTGVMGQTWTMRPAPGNLTQIEAGFQTGLGWFEASYLKNGTGFTYNFEAPSSTTGTLRVEAQECAGTLVAKGQSGQMGKAVSVEEGEITKVESLEGGKWTVKFICN
ncbi:MAG: hypothetical protein M1834_004598 [Cirrosporium novae-zelandiae]|nr:MAG: hypothetical protein M1834_004598 [Cirrosporium novae-zelandiae]